MTVTVTEDCHSRISVSNSSDAGAGLQSPSLEYLPRAEWFTNNLGVRQIPSPFGKTVAPLSSVYRRNAQSSSLKKRTTSLDHEAVSLVPLVNQSPETKTGVAKVTLGVPRTFERITHLSFVCGPRGNVEIVNQREPLMP